MKNVLFYRNYTRLCGGDLKVWDYFQHVQNSPGHEASIRFSETTVWDEINPWWEWRDKKDQWQNVRPDLFFLSGRDWRILDAQTALNSPVPIINFIQHVRHGQPDDPRFVYLQNKAIRVCVSEEVKDAILATGQVNGPVFVIPNAIDIAKLPARRAPEEYDYEVLIVALKQPKLGGELLHRLEGLAWPLQAAKRRVGRAFSGFALRQRFKLISSHLPRHEFLQHLSRAKVTVFLPMETEGFYLPALEGMALGTIVVCPDCVGNRSFCLAGRNCFRPDYTLEKIWQAVNAARGLASDAARQMRAHAGETALGHDLPGERAAFWQVLEAAPTLW